MRKLLVVLIAAATSACAGQPTPSAPPSAQAAAPAEPARPSRLWNVERETCAELLAAPHEDRAAVAMYYYGYVTARAGIRVIDGAQIETRVRRALAACEASPTSPIAQAFQRALVPRRPAQAPRAQTPPLSLPARGQARLQRHEPGERDDGAA